MSPPVAETFNPRAVAGRLPSAAWRPVDAVAERVVRSVDIDALRHNLAVLRASGGDRWFMPVVKGDAYGFDAVAVGRVLAAAGADALAVDTIAEGLDLRAAGLGLPVLVMDTDVPDNAEACVYAGLTPAVARPDQVSRYAELAERRSRPVTVWLRTNVGFNRFGARDDAGFAELLDAVDRHHPSVQAGALFAHLSSAAHDEQETREQAAAFRHRHILARRRLGSHVAASLAATHGLVHPESLAGTSWIRPGIGLYGIVQPESRRLSGWTTCGLSQLRPAFEIRARVLDIVTLTSREGVGYARSVPVRPGQRLASVAIGFSRGVTSAATGMTGLLAGARCPMVGRPGMDCTEFDVTDAPARVGAWMTFVGGSGNAVKTAEETATEMGCSLYELLAMVRAPVRMIDSDGLPHGGAVDGRRTNVG